MKTSLIAPWLVTTRTDIIKRFVFFRQNWWHMTWNLKLVTPAPVRVSSPCPECHVSHVCRLMIMGWYWGCPQTWHLSYNWGNPRNLGQLGDRLMKTVWQSSPRMDPLPLLYCIVLMGWSLVPNASDLVKIYCAPPNLGIARTWICRLNFAQRPIFFCLEVL